MRQKTARELRRQNDSFDRSSVQCSTEVKQLKNQHKDDEVDKLRKRVVGEEGRRGGGLEGDDELLFWFVDSKSGASTRTVVSASVI